MNDYDLKPYRQKYYAYVEKYLPIVEKMTPGIELFGTIEMLADIWHKLDQRERDKFLIKSE